MTRKQIINFCNENIFNQVDITVAPYMDCFEVVKMVCKWRIGKSIYTPMVARVDDGFLFMNGEKVGRIAPKMPKVAYNPKACYREGMILARQEEMQ